MSYLPSGDVVTFPLGHSRVRTSNGPGRAMAVWITEPVVVKRMFKWFGPANAAANVQLGIYDAAGTRLAVTPVFTPVSGFNTYALDVPVSLTRGLSFFAFTWTAGQIEALYGPWNNDDRQGLGAVIGFGALPATITPDSVTTYAAWWLGAGP